MNYALNEFSAHNTIESKPVSYCRHTETSKVTKKSLAQAFSTL